jgi:hypothetical protein
MILAAACTAVVNTMPESPVCHFNSPRF